MGAAAAAEDERTRGQRGRERRGLLLERVAFDHGRLRIGERYRRRLGHRAPSAAPRPRHANEAGAEAPAAGMAFVLGADRDGGERSAIRTAGAQSAQSILRS